MSLLVALKVVCDLSLLCCVAAVVAPWFTLSAGNLLLPLLCCGVGIFAAAQLSEKGRARYAGLVFCAAAPFLSETGVGLAVTLLMALYCVYIIHMDLLTLYYDGYHDFFLTGAKFVAGCFVFASINMDWLDMMPYGVLYFAGGVFLLRMLRLGEHAGRQSLLLNAAAMIGAMVVGCGLCAAAYFVLLLRFPLVAGYQWIMVYVLDAVEELVYFFGEIIMYVIAYFAALLYSRKTGEVEVEGSGTGEAPYEPPEMVVNETAGAVAGAITLLVICGLLIFLAVKAIRAAGARRNAGRRVRTQHIPDGERRKGERVTGNRARVRAVYRKFIRLILEKGAEIPDNATSEDVLCAAALVADGRDCSALREVYISARYDSGREVTPGQVKEAKNLYNKLKEPS